MVAPAWQHQRPRHNGGGLLLHLPSCLRHLLSQQRCAQLLPMSAPQMTTSLSPSSPPSSNVPASSPVVCAPDLILSNHFCRCSPPIFVPATFIPFPLPSPATFAQAVAMST